MEDCRPARAEDVPRVAELARGLEAELRALRGGVVWAADAARPEPLEPVFHRLLEDSDVAVIVGLIDGVIVGFGVVTVDTLRTGDRLGRITELFVEPPARAVGVGEAVARGLVAFAEARSAVGVDALALPGHRETKNFFEEQGFTARALVMHRAAKEA